MRKYVKFITIETVKNIFFGDILNKQFYVTKEN